MMWWIAACLVVALILLPRGPLGGPLVWYWFESWWYWHVTSHVKSFWDCLMERYFDKDCSWNTKGSGRRELKRIIRDLGVKPPHINDCI